MARMDRCQIQVTCTSWMQSSCTIFRTFVILSRGTAEIICLLQYRCVQAFLCATHLEVGEEVIQGPFLQTKVCVSF